MVPLPRVAAELEILARAFPPGDLNHQLVGASASRTAVLDALTAHSWVHFACFANQDSEDPARSGFLLWDGVLTTSDLAALPTQPRELAFLSANETATGGTRHPDESLHLAAAMQFIGYRHVIAIAGSTADNFAVRVASTFYDMLDRDSENNSDFAATALHHTLMHLREMASYRVSFWMSYIHLGA